MGFAPAEGELLSHAMDRLLSDCFRELRPGGRVLDVGAGLGGTVALLARAGFRAVGVDPDPRAVSYARARAPAGAELRCGLLSDVADGPFDALFLTEVLQHYRELDPLLARCRALLAPTSSTRPPGRSSRKQSESSRSMAWESSSPSAGAKPM